MEFVIFYLVLPSTYPYEFSFTLCIPTAVIFLSSFFPLLRQVPVCDSMVMFISGKFGGCSDYEKKKKKLPELENPSLHIDGFRNLWKYGYECLTYEHPVLRCK